MAGLSLRRARQDVAIRFDHETGSGGDVHDDLLVDSVNLDVVAVGITGMVDEAEDAIGLKHGIDRVHERRCVDSRVDHQEAHRRQLPRHGSRVP